jgi:mono/diheme cytochrome c family protein
MPRRLSRFGALGLATALAAGATLAAMPWSRDMVEQPSVPPFAGPRAPVEGTVPRGGEVALERWRIERVAVNPRAGAGPTATGKQLFLVYCAPCHGETGRGDGPVAKRFAPPRDLTEPAAQALSAGWIYGTIRMGAASMPRYGHELTPAERWDIVEFVKGLGGSRP